MTSQEFQVRRLLLPTVALVAGLILTLGLPLFAVQDTTDSSADDSTIRVDQLSGDEPLDDSSEPGGLSIRPAS